MKNKVTKIIPLIVLALMLMLAIGLLRLASEEMPAPEAGHINATMFGDSRPTIATFIEGQFNESVSSNANAVNENVAWNANNAITGAIDVGGNSKALVAGMTNVMIRSGIDANVIRPVTAIVAEQILTKENPKIAIFLHTAHLRSIRAFDKVTVIDSPVNLSIYQTLNAAGYINEALNLTEYNVIIVKTAGYEEEERNLQVDALLPLLEPARDAGVEIAVMDTDHNISTINLTEHPFISEYFENLVHFATVFCSVNAHNLLNYIYVNFMNGTADVHPPVIPPTPGIYHPDAPSFFFNNTADYLTWAANRADNPFNKDQPTVGILACAFFTSGYVMDEFVRQIEKRGANVIIVYPIPGRFTGIENPALPLFYYEGEPLVDTVISFHNIIRAVPDEMRVDQFKELNVPVLGGISLGGMFGRMTPEEWKNCTRGINLARVGFVLTPKELLGVAAPTVIAGMHIDEFGGRVDVPIPEQITRLVGRAINHAMLSHTPNEDKNIAIIHFGYGASGLNIERSLERLLSELKKEGYTVDPMNETEITEAMLAHGRNIGMWAQPTLDRMVQDYSDRLVLIPISEYRDWFKEMIPNHRQEEVFAFWGEPADGSMVVNHNGEPHFVIPMIRTGNIMIMPQPTRGGGTVDEAVVFHDAQMPPNHHYIAFYLWLQRQNIDAIIHFGTHGSQEWLPGKERGLAADCWPSLMSGEIPIIYPYIVDNVGEATIAKRRGDAVIISYMTPQLVAAGLYGDLRTLHDMVHHYKEIPDPAVRAGERRRVIEKAINMSIDKEMEMPGFEGIPWDSNLTDMIHEHIHKIESQVIPVGLHILGEIPDKALMYESVLKMVGPGFTDEIKNVGKITDKHKCCCEGGYEGYIHECYIEEIARTKAKEMLRMALLKEISLVDIQQQILNNNSDILTEYLKNGAGHLRNFLRVYLEIEAIITALSGGFILPGSGGDPIRNPESLPTGRNLYSFDPREVPTRTSWDIGKAALQVALKEHYETHGEYPDKMAFVLFAGETMRHRGVAEAQILYALGVRPIWDEFNRVRVDDERDGLEIIAGAELGRPRIDAVVTMTCLYRDTFSCRVGLIDAAVRLVGAHEEEGQINHIRYNYLALRAELEYIYPDMDAETVENLALARIFGPAAGAYGLGLGGIVKAGGTWDERSELAKSYLNRMGNIYSQNLWGESNRLVFDRALSGTDVAIFSRSSNFYGVLTSDHPFSWLGGLSMAIEHVYEGGAPQLMITDLRNPHKDGETISLNRFLRTELRARSYNPRWIKGLMEHGFSGAGVISGTITNLWGWQVVTPDIVTDDMWNELYAIYIQDKYNLDLDEFFSEYNPLAKQELMRRMLEAYERGFWDADAAIVRDLVERVIKSVAEHGLSCCVSCCANPRMDSFLAEMMKEGRVELDRETIARFDEQRIATLGVGLAGLEAALEVAPEVVIEPPAELLREVVGEVMEVVQPEAPHFHLDLPVSKLIAAFILIALIGVGYLVITKKAKK
ncbi:cobaltochelatase subunit CobN [Thermodesulfovibrionales bacterium]|nr:cobaltochelatase subunit CobN [Thermodesulfovibrionales bacterium]